MAYYNGKKVLSVVAVEYLTPNGTIKLTENGSYDVRAYKKAVVSVFPSGTIQTIEDESVGISTEQFPLTALGKGLLNYVGGMSQKVNQLFDNAYLPTTQTLYGITITNNGDGSITINGTADNEVIIPMYSPTFDSGHYYLFVGGELGQYGINTYDDNMWGATAIIGGAQIRQAQTGGQALTGLRVAVENGASISNKTIRLMYVDLTAIYGAGNEPTTTSDPRIQWLINYFAEHPEYNEGEIVNAVVENILSMDDKGVEANWFLNNINKVGSYTFSGNEQWTISDNGNYAYISFTQSGYKTPTSDDVKANMLSGFATTETYNAIYYGNASNAIGSSRWGELVISIALYNDRASLVGKTIIFELAEPLPTPTLTPTDILNAIGAEYTSYPIPAEVQALDGYGYGINADCYNYIDFERKKYVKKVAVVDLSTLYWMIGSNGVYFADISNIKFSASAICSTYQVVDSYPTMENTNKSLWVHDLANRIVIKDTDISDTSEITGTLVYELATPVETDISEYLDTAFTDENLISLFQGGVVRFENESGLEDTYSLTYQYQVE